jgi:hypothetical protein
LLTVACVLRSGPEYRVEHVAALAAGVREHLTLPHRLVCLTDLVGEVEGAGVETLPLREPWPGWWAKIALFEPGIFDDGAVFYLDLDTVVRGPIDELAVGHRFTVLQNFWAPDRIGSGLMAWDTAADLSQIYQRFCAAPEAVMRRYVTRERWGDQGFIQFNCPVQPELWQVKHPGRVVSYRRDVLPAGRVPRGAAVICFGGKARPWNTRITGLEAIDVQK